MSSTAIPRQIVSAHTETMSSGCPVATIQPVAAASGSMLGMIAISPSRSDRKATIMTTRISIAAVPRLRARSTTI